MPEPLDLQPAWQIPSYGDPPDLHQMFATFGQVAVQQVLLYFDDRTGRDLAFADPSGPQPLDGMRCWLRDRHWEERYESQAGAWVPTPKGYIAHQVLDTGPDNLVAIYNTEQDSEVQVDLTTRANRRYRISWTGIAYDDTGPASIVLRLKVSAAGGGFGGLDTMKLDPTVGGRPVDGNRFVIWEPAAGAKRLKITTQAIAQTGAALLISQPDWRTQLLVEDIGATV